MSRDHFQNARIELLREESAVKIQALWRGYRKRYSYDVMDHFRQQLHDWYSPLYLKDGSKWDKTIICEFRYSSASWEAASGCHVDGEEQALPWGFHYIERMHSVIENEGWGHHATEPYIKERLRRYRELYDEGKRHLAYCLKLSTPRLSLEYNVTLQREKRSNGVRLTHEGGSVVLFATPQPRFYPLKKLPWDVRGGYFECGDLTRTRRSWRVRRAGPSDKIARWTQREFNASYLNRPLQEHSGGVTVPEHYKHPQVQWRDHFRGNVPVFHPTIEMELREQAVQTEMILESALSNALKRSADAGHLKRAASRKQKKIIKRAKTKGQDVGVHRCLETYRAVNRGEPLVDASGREYTIPPFENAQMFPADNRIILQRVRGAGVYLTYNLTSSHMQRHGHHAPGSWNPVSNRSAFGVSVRDYRAPRPHKGMLMTKRSKAFAERATSLGRMKISQFDKTFLKDKSWDIRDHVMQHILGFCMFTKMHIPFKSRYTETLQ